MHRKLTLRRPAAILIAAVAGLLVATAPVFADAPDRFEPPVVNATLAAGESMTVGKLLHLTGLPAKADIIIAIDTTGSMGGAITQAKTEAIQICNDVKAMIPGARFAAVDFEDYPGQPLGGPGDTPYLLLTPGYVADCLTFSAAINTMVADGGGDGPEAYNRAHFEAYSDLVLLASRDPQATRFLVELGDNFPHSDAAFGACPVALPTDPGRDGLPGGGDDLNTPLTITGLSADDTTLLMIAYNTGAAVLPCYEDMAAATGGDAVPAGGAGTISAFIIAQAAATPYTVDLVVAGQCPPVGISFSPAPTYGPFSGPSHINFTETITAPTVPGNYTCTITAVMTPGGPTTAVETVNLTVGPADPFTLVLTPETDENTVDDQHCVTATVRDAFGNPTPNITVRFSVTGSVTTGGSVTTNAAGQAEFCYTGPGLPGADVITAYADTDNDNVNDATEPEDTATKTWVIPDNQEGCKVTYGGRITAANGDKATFGGNAKGVGPAGVEEYQDHGPLQGMNVHSIDVLSVTCSTDGTSASIFGTATIDGAGTWDYRIDVKDPAAPGLPDTYRIRLSNLYDSGEQPLSGGNVQIH